MKLCTDCQHDVDVAQAGEVIPVCWICSMHLHRGRSVGVFVVDGHPSDEPEEQADWLASVEGREVKLRVWMPWSRRGP